MVGIGKIIIDFMHLFRYALKKTHVMIFEYVRGKSY
jgi:hypothetical protein